MREVEETFPSLKGISVGEWDNNCWDIIEKNLIDKQRVREALNEVLNDINNESVLHKAQLEGMNPYYHGGFIAGLLNSTRRINKKFKQILEDE